MKALIQKLVETPGPSGFESAVRELIRSELESLAKHIGSKLTLRTDALGNLIAERNSQKPGGKKIMLVAHMDEIGIIVTHVDPDGFVRFTNLGGVRPINCIGGRVRFLNSVSGVIGVEKLSDANRTPTIEQMFIDVGAANREVCPVHLGDVAIFKRPFNEQGKRLVAKAMDDRVGVAILIETLRQLKESPHHLIFVFSVQEEVGLRGATTAAFGVEPEIGLAVDVTLTGDTPKGYKMEVALGKGPAIKVRDMGMISDPRVVDWMSNTARKEHIPFQLEILEMGGTDARAIQLSRAGAPAGCLSIPCRYVHSPSEMVDLDDIEQAVHLLVEMLSQPVEIS